MDPPILNVPASSRQPRFFICVDYGTTYTGVSWALTTGAIPTREDVNVVTTWGGPIAQKVPSLFTYSPNSGELWGYNIGNKAFIIRWSKLELDTPDRLAALKILRRTIEEARQMHFGRESVLRSQIPRHLVRSTPDIITDYLKKVAKCVRLDIEAKRDPQSLKEFPIDLVVTHPAEWDYKACNSTFRAANEAFRSIFPEIPASNGVVRMATEPEACAQFTMRAALDTGVNRLHAGECAIVVDAGGGTVDLVSYLVEEVVPFRPRKVTDVCGSKCGASRIDDAFLEGFLPSKLSKEEMDFLRSGTTNHEKHSRGEHFVLSRRLQVLLDEFQTIKHAFAGKPVEGQPDTVEWLNLIEGVGNENDPSRGIQNGQLRISSSDLELMFQTSVDGTISLINKQLMLVDTRGLHVKTLFLSGGFSQSPYLFRRVRELTEQYSIGLIRGSDSWSAVSQGGVLLGLGLGCNQPPVSMPCPFHIGVVLAERWAEYDHELDQRYEDSYDNVARANDNVKWLFIKGDLVPHDKPLEFTQSIVKKLARNGSRVGNIKLIFSTLQVNHANPPQGLDGKPPTYLSQLPTDARREVDLRYDLANATRSLRPQRNAQYIQTEMQLKVHINQQRADFQLLSGGDIPNMFGRLRGGGVVLDSHTEPLTTPGF